MDFGSLELYFKINHIGKLLSRPMVDQLCVDQGGQILPYNVLVVTDVVCQGLAFETQVWQLGSWLTLAGDGAFQCLLQ